MKTIAIVFSFVGLFLWAPHIIAAEKPAAEATPGSVLAVMKQVADWQMAHPSRHRPTDWTQGAWYAGMMALAAVADAPKYHDAMMQMGEGNRWQLGPREYHADDHCVGMAYCELYMKHKNAAMIKPLIERFDGILAKPSCTVLDFKVPGSTNRWSWCDALFMAPPAWLRLAEVTGEKKYLEFMNREWWATTDYLYDKEEHLYFRDSTYFTRREANGKKVFWCRGNSWVVAGLARVLPYLPKDHPDRARYETLFKEMCAKVLSLQQPDGLWRASLLDPASYPLKEASGSGFFCFGLAWGINNGLLDRAVYEPAVRKAWAGLVGCVEADGKLTHVQPPGGDPKKFDAGLTDVYGVGAFLLAGREVYRLAKDIGVSPMQPLPAGAEAPAEEERYIKVVREFADNVLEHGRDKYGPKHTPLFVDGIDVKTREPVKWVNGGQTWIMSNLANQQNLFRTLVGLTNLTGDPKYRQGAVDATKYAFEHLRGPNGLLFWGGHCLYDAGTEKIAGELHGKVYEHELKSHYPYYEFMWEVDPEATKKYLEAFWAAHILDWSILDMNRHGAFTKERGDLWKNEYKGGKVFFVGRGLTFLNAGSDLYYAGAMLHKLTGEKGPLTWAKRMAYRYVETRDPKTGLGGIQYSMIKGDRAREQFGPEFGDKINEGTILTSFSLKFAVAPICQLKLAELLGEEGEDFLKWAHEDLTAFAKHAYDPKDNSYGAMITDGTKLTPEDYKRDGYYKKRSLERSKADATFFWAYTLAHRLTYDKLMWQMARNIGQQGTGIGDIGDGPDAEPKLNMTTRSSSPHTLFGLLELYRATNKKCYLDLAKKIGDNIIEARFHKGFFTPDKNNPLAKFDCISPLALVHLAAAIKGKPELAPSCYAGRAYFHCSFDGKGRTYDNTVFWGWGP